MKSILELSGNEAKKYFLEPKNYCSLEMPAYISFNTVLAYAQKKIGKASFDDVLENKKKPSEFEGVNHIILAKKDSNFSYRPIQIANPFLYYLLVRELTTDVHWAEIKKRFEDFKQPQIEVSSIPVEKGEDDKSHQSAQVSVWWEVMEQKSITLGLRYKYMFVTDITNCYGSLYTHTIAWALMGKDEAKIKKDKAGCLGNIIDRYMQGMQNGQTNGIPLGGVLFDFIAEIVLGYSDMLLCEKLNSLGITEYKILRYRDDYRIFSNSKEEIEKIVFYLQSILSELNFQLNSKKTYLTEEIVQNSVKPDKLAYLTGAPLYKKRGKRITSMASSFQQEMMYIDKFGKDFPNSGTLIKLLTGFSTRLRHTKRIISEMDARVMISMLVDIAVGSPKSYKLVLHLISILIDKIPTTEERKVIVSQIYNKFSLIPNVGELQIWMQHITFKMPDPIQYAENICRIVAGEKGIAIWNNDWVREDLRRDFPQDTICSKLLLAATTPTIDIDEFSLFEVY